MTAIINACFLLVLLLGCSAFFSSSETSLFSLNPIRIQHLQSEGVASAAIIARLLNHPSNVLVTILLGNQIVNTLAASTMAAICVRLLGDTIGPVVATVGMLLLLLIFGEVTPKTAAVQNPQKVAFFVCRPLFWFSKAIFPVRVILTGIADGILWVLGGRGHGYERLSEAEEFRTLLDISHREGVVETSERQIMHNLLDFSEMTVKEIMIPRTDMFCFSINDRFDDIIQKCRTALYARVPVYEGTLDTICGVVYMKELLPFIQGGAADFQLRAFLRNAYFVPETKKVQALLKEFQAQKIHMALVMDEYGGTAGLVCLEDVLEEIVGEITDEFDTEEIAWYQPLPDGKQFRVDARMHLHEFNQIFGSDLAVDAYGTVGGLMLDLLGKVPHKDDVVGVGNLTLRVNKLHQIRIVEVIVSKGATAC